MQGLHYEESSLGIKKFEKKNKVRLIKHYSFGKVPPVHKKFLKLE